MEIPIIWHKYNLKQNPYFTSPLTIEGSVVPIETLVGREREKKEILKNISLGGGTRFIVIGEAGVGKTSLVNYVRAEARKNLFFTPVNEIRIQDGWSPTQLVIDVLQNIYNEIKSQEIQIENQGLLKALEDLFEISRIIEADDINPEAVLSINLTQATRLYNEIVREIINIGGYKSIIIHFNNLDNIDQIPNYQKLFNNLRDFFQNNQSIFIFIGFNFLPFIINEKPKIRQIFNNVPINIGKLSLEEIIEIINSRLEFMQIQERKYIIPHTEGSVKLLYGLYNGNARDILNSLSTSIIELNIGNSPVKINEIKLKKILFNIANENFLRKVSPNEKQVLFKIIEMGKATNSELAKTLNKQRQHISSYLRTLLEIRAIKLELIEGSKKYYTPSPESLWLKLKVTEEEIKKARNKEIKKIEEYDQDLRQYLKTDELDKEDYFKDQTSTIYFMQKEKRSLYITTSYKNAQLFNDEWYKKLQIKDYTIYRIHLTKQVKIKEISKITRPKHENWILNYNNCL